jgi:UDP-N-acetyl-D-mannosaminuronate dehydrogenase
LGHDVLGVDIDVGKLEKLTAGEAPFYEPGLDEVLKNNVDAGRLRFTSSYEEAAEFANVLQKFLEHRIADNRVLRLIAKWLNAGVIEEGRWTASDEGAP